MPNTPAETLTKRQCAWMAAIREGLARETGRTIDEWVEIARTCPAIKHRARLKWMKDEHSLGQNRASMVLNTAFPSDAGWSQPDMLADALWADPALKALFATVKAEILALPEVVTGQRKTYTAFSRAFQFAAMRPAKGAVLLGLAVPINAAPGLITPKRPVWSERLKSQMTIEIDANIAPLTPLIRQAWEAS